MTNSNTPGFPISLIASRSTYCSVSYDCLLFFIKNDALGKYLQKTCSGHLLISVLPLILYFQLLQFIKIGRAWECQKAIICF